MRATHLLSSSAMPRREELQAILDYTERLIAQTSFIDNGTAALTDARIDRLQTIREGVAARAFTQDYVAEVLGVTRQRVSQMIRREA